MGGDYIETAGKSWKEIAMQWLIGQGVSTVLLFSIFAGGGYFSCYGLPSLLMEVRNSYKEINERNSVAIEKLAATHEKAMDRMAAMIETNARRIEASHDRSEGVK
jgi:hypothetical protein